MASPEDNNGIRDLLKENLLLAQENNALLKKIHRWNVIGASLKVFWFLIIIGFPFALYFLVLEPYFTALGSDYEIFKAGIGEIPGLKGLEGMFPDVGAK